MKENSAGAARQNLPFWRSLAYVPCGFRDGTVRGGWLRVGAFLDSRVNRAKMEQGHPSVKGGESSAFLTKSIPC